MSSIVGRWRGRLKLRQALLAAAKKRAALRAQQVAAAQRVIRRHSKAAVNGPVVMFDSIVVSEIPKNAMAVAGYTSGRWPTYLELVKRFPKAQKLSIAVNASHDATCLDVEPGDAQNKDAAGWVRRQQRRGVKRPVIYTSVSNVAALLGVLRHQGVQRSEIRLWTAHYTGRSHLCSPACYQGMPTTADATQWTDKSGGRNLDESLCNGGFFS
jgi:hypothetical protein